MPADVLADRDPSCHPLLMPAEAKRQRGVTTVSSKNQVTLPVAALRTARVGPGDQLRVSVDGTGRLTLTPLVDPILAITGAVPGLTHAADLERMRDAWLP